MNKVIWKYIANCTLCHREKTKIQNYPLQMMEIPNRPFDKIAIDLITECETSTSRNKHILTIIDHLTGGPEAIPIPNKTVDTIVSSFISEYLPVHMYPWYILLDNGTEFKNSLMDQVLQQLGLTEYHHKVMASWKSFINTKSQHWRSCVKKTHPAGTNFWIKF